MKIVLTDAGRRFNRDWIFRHIDFTLNEGDKLALLGNNGSGKSTLLQIMAGYLSPSEGTIRFFLGEKSVHPDDVFKHVTLATPYTTVHEEMTLQEVLDFHFAFKKPLPMLTLSAIPAFLRMDNQMHKPIRFFSSGMKQRLKLGLAMATESELLLLDEPASNLDEENIQWYRQSMEKFGHNRTVVVCSNRFDREFDFCNRQLVVDDFKQVGKR